MLWQWCGALGLVEEHECLHVNLMQDLGVVYSAEVSMAKTRHSSAENPSTLRQTPRCRGIHGNELAWDYRDFVQVCVERTVVVRVFSAIKVANALLHLGSPASQPALTGSLEHRG